MPSGELIIRQGILATSGQCLDLAVSEGRFLAVAPGAAGDFRAEIDATGLHIFPGIIDAHVHFNEPGRTEWEGFATGSRALAAGGATLFFDMPLNAHPPTIDAESFGLKLAAAQASSVVDFAFWGGLVPGNGDKLAELAECGVIGFKAFMSNSGIDDFCSVDDQTLREGMKRARQLNLPVAIHAESELITTRLARERVAAGRVTVRDFLNSRPVAAELDAIARAIEMAGETSCALHIVHVSSAQGVELVTQARERGVDVSCETCPHYLTLTEDDMERLGAIAKCAPPLRAAGEMERLWNQVLRGSVQTIGSDHSPSPPGMKTGADFFKVWGGISGAQHTLPLLLTEGHFKRGLALPLLCRLLSSNLIKRFRLPPEKNGLTPGADADFSLVDLRQNFPITKEELLYRHPQSPYVGRALRGKVVLTFQRGRTIFHDGKFVAKPAGRLIKPRR